MFVMFSCSRYVRNTFLWETNSLHPFSSSFPITDICQSLLYTKCPQPSSDRQKNRGTLNGSNFHNSCTVCSKNLYNDEVNLIVSYSTTEDKVDEFPFKLETSALCAKLADQYRAVLEYVVFYIFHAEPGWLLLIISIIDGPKCVLPNTSSTS